MIIPLESKTPLYHLYLHQIRSICFSPGLSPFKRIQAGFSSSALTPVSTNKDRFVDKDSLYLDVGRPEINGRIETINNGSTHNSISYQNRASEFGSSNASSNSAMSPFSKSPLAEHRKQNTRSFKVNASIGSNQSFLKAAIYRNMQRNDEDCKDDMSSGLKADVIRTEKKRNTDYVIGHQPEKVRTGSHSPTIFKPADSPTSLDSPFQLKLEQVQQVQPHSAIPAISIKTSQRSSRRFQPFAQKD